MKRLLILSIILFLSTTAFAQTYTVERVIDGNTIVVSNPEGKSEKVRLIGIDAPESEPNDKAKRDSERTGRDLEIITKMRQEATEIVKKFIQEGQEVCIEFDVEKKDKYNRYLAYVYVNVFGNPYISNYRMTGFDWPISNCLTTKGIVWMQINSFLVRQGQYYFFFLSRTHSHLNQRHHQTHPCWSIPLFL